MKKIIFASSLLCMFSCSSKNSNCIDESRINKDAICTEDYNPVCGCNKITYTNACKAKAEGVTSWDNGACAGDKKK
jgi:hypothetical protein